jgi:hypothetical protein
MDWCNNKCTISNISLSPLLDRIVDVRVHFQSLSFEHVYREFNMKAHELSKEDLLLEEGTLVTQEFTENSSFPAVQQFIHRCRFFGLVRWWIAKFEMPYNV